MKILLLVLTILMTIVLLCGDYFIKKATQSLRPEMWLYFTAVLWVSSIYGWYYIVKDERIAIVGALFSVLSLIGTVLIGIIGFNEHLSYKEWIGFGLGMIAVLLLSGKL